MKMQIVVAEATGASALARQLADYFGSDRVTVSGACREVDVRIEGNSDGAILRVLDAVWRWLDHAAGDSAEMRLGKRSYTMAR